MTTPHFARLFAARAALGCALGFGMGIGLMFAAAAPAAVAQNRGPVQRTVRGRVEDKSGHGIKGAVVYLKDSNTSSVKSAIAEDDGSYRFVQLSQNTDYEIWAKSDGKKSNIRTISSFDSKNNYDITLKISQ